MSLALLVSLPACGSHEPIEPNETRSAAPVTVLRMADVPQWTPVSAQVATVDQAQVLARIPGILVSLSVAEGDYVKKGQVIGRIVDSQLGYQSGVYGAQAAAAQAQAVATQAELHRISYLYENGVYAKARLEQAQAAASAAQAQVRAAQAQQQAVNAVAGQGAIVAPTSGRVLAADVPAGSPVAPGMSIAIITAGPAVLRLDLPETLAGRVKVGARVLVSGLEGEGTGSGTVTKVYPAVTAGIVRADATLAGLDSTLIGRRVAAKVTAGTRMALLVPKAYVTTRFGIDYVEVKAKDGAVSTVPVQATQSDESGKIEILSGVAAGDVLVAGPAQ